MNLSEMRLIVRRDLHDEDSNNYRWTNDKIDRHLTHAVKDFSEALPLEQKATLPTTAGSREISITSLTNRVMIEAVEYPAGQFPKRYQRFSIWQDILTLLGTEIPDGTDCYIYYGKLHTLDLSSSTIPAKYEDIVANGACGYAAFELAVYSVNRVNTGGSKTTLEWQELGKQKIDFFRSELKRLGSKNKVRVKQLYTPYNPVVSKTTDWGP
jgi:hypothetical protein